MTISKRKLESYRRAELVCREFRYQISGNINNMDLNPALELLIKWMDVTGKVKFDRPGHETATSQRSKTD